MPEKKNCTQWKSEKVETSAAPLSYTQCNARNSTTKINTHASNTNRKGQQGLVFAFKTLNVRHMGAAAVVLQGLERTRQVFQGSQSAAWAGRSEETSQQAGAA
jgi:hypothetical protein